MRQVVHKRHDNYDVEMPLSSAYRKYAKYCGDDDGDDDDDHNESSDNRKEKQQTTAAADDDVAVVVEVVNIDTTTTTTSTSTTSTASSGLSRRDVLNLVFLLLAWACTVCCLTLVVGTSAVVVLSVGGTTSTAPFALGMFFLGMSIVSLCVTPWLFTKYGRKIGFIIGSLIFGCLLGTVLCIVGLILNSSWIVIIANLPLGASIGIGMYIRYAAVEIVPQRYSAFALTLVLSGGCIAAFVGPESAYHTKGIFFIGQSNYEYLGVFIMTGIFQISNAIFVTLVQFGDDDIHNNDSNDNNANASNNECCSTVHNNVKDINRGTTPAEGDNSITSENKATITINDKTNTAKNNNNTAVGIIKLICNLLCSSSSSHHQRRHYFVKYVSVSTLCWSIMAMPMSMALVAMKEVGYTTRNGLITIELHFLGMYAPGFLSGKLLTKYGTNTVLWIALGCFILGLTFNLISQQQKQQQESSNISNIVTWMFGLLFLGCGWNFGFSAATMGLSKVYSYNYDHDHHHSTSSSNASSSLNNNNNNNNNSNNDKSQIQAANDFLMFALSGAGILSSGYIFNSSTRMSTSNYTDNDDTVAALNGWRTLNYVCLGLSCILLCIMIIHHYFTIFHNSITTITKRRRSKNHN